MSEHWEKIARDEDIVGWKITLSGQGPGSFYVKDEQLKQLDLTLDKYILWLRLMKPHKD